MEKYLYNLYIISKIIKKLYCIEYFKLFQIIISLIIHGIALGPCHGYCPRATGCRVCRPARAALRRTPLDSQEMKRLGAGGTFTYGPPRPQGLHFAVSVYQTQPQGNDRRHDQPVSLIAAHGDRTARNGTGEAFSWWRTAGRPYF